MLFDPISLHTWTDMKYIEISFSVWKWASGSPQGHIAVRKRFIETWLPSERRFKIVKVCITFCCILDSCVTAENYARSWRNNRRICSVSYWLHYLLYFSERAVQGSWDIQGLAQRQLWINSIQFKMCIPQSYIRKVFFFNKANIASYHAVHKNWTEYISFLLGFYSTSVHIAY